MGNLDRLFQCERGLGKVTPRYPKHRDRLVVYGRLELPRKGLDDVANLDEVPASKLDGSVVRNAMSAMDDDVAREALVVRKARD